MQNPSLAELVPAIQTAIGPAILISAVGLLLLTLVNRLNHVVDRTRALAAHLAECRSDPERVRTAAQLDILWQRAGLLRGCIGFASASALFSALLILVLFLSTLFRIEDAGLIGGLFVMAMAALIVSLLFFMNDINRSLRALKLELDGNGRQPG
jgi:hypothetical protein